MTINAILTSTPFASISDRMSSHRSAQAIIYADMIANEFPKVSVTINFGNNIETYNDFPVMIVYHGNDFTGGLNLFGGLENTQVAESLVKFSQFKGKVISLGIEFPDYVSLIKSRLSNAKKDYPKFWDQIDFDNLNRMRKESSVFKNPKSNKIAVGDSHAICLYRPGWQINSVPFKTLNGSLTEGLSKYVESKTKIDEAEFMFGAIDIRHHLCRISDNHEKNAKDLANRYLKAVNELDIPKKIIYVPIPLENESRKIPGTGFYKGKPFWGSLAERNNARNIFIQTLKDNTFGIEIRDPWEYLLNDKGELDFEHMEKPRSVHLSRAAYPYWKGENWQPNKIKKIESKIKKDKKIKVVPTKKYDFDWSNFNKEIMGDFNWFLYKVNQRACINHGYDDSKYEGVNRKGEIDYGLGINVEYFHPTITLDDRMRFIAENISTADISLFSIVCNTFISHFYGARGVHQLLTQTNDVSKCYADFDRIADNDQKYIQQLRSNLDYAKEMKYPIWGTTELHTSIQTSGRNYCRKKYNDPNRSFHPIDVCEWVASFRDNGVFEGMKSANHIGEIYKLLRTQPGIGDYYGFHAAASTSVLPQLKYHHDQKFVAPGPGAVYLINQLWPNSPKKLHAEAVYFLRENSDEIGLTTNVNFHEKAQNIFVKGKPIFSEPQDGLKYYGTEVLCCQFGIYLQIRNDKKLCDKRKVSRSESIIFPKSLF